MCKIVRFLRIALDHPTYPVQTSPSDTDLRENVFYVDYDQEQEKWSKGIIKINAAKVKEFISDIRKSIKLIAS